MGKKRDKKRPGSCRRSFGRINRSRNGLLFCLNQAKKKVKRRLFGDEREQELNTEEVPLLEEVPISIDFEQSNDSEPLFTDSEGDFPADCHTFGDKLTTMGFEKLIVLKAIELFGMDENKCIGKKANNLRLYSFFQDFLSCQAELQLENETTNGDEIIKAQL